VSSAARIVAFVWPEAVERVATFLRASGAEGQLEELLAGAHAPPGVRLATTALECERRLIVALIPAGRRLDRRKLARAADCSELATTRHPEFPFSGATVFLEQTVLTEPILWLEAGTSRHVLGLAPAQLTSLTRAVAADLIVESQKGGG
jgi:prolyl-tRNA editing enzyme YbaK/EbsC (Cys-tRNA(Pro) deacylase)